jgi:serine/threonine protein kinase
MTVSQVLVAGRYRLVRSLGRGGMGQVWLARDEVLHRDVAVKEVVLPAGLTDTELEELRQRTLREARAAARLSHPNVVQIYDVVRIDDQPWIVMEYVQSRSLHRVINEDGPLSPEHTARLGLAVLAALGAAHGAGVLHRDVKPSNVLISDAGRVVLTDFGLATFDGGDNAVTRPGLVLGSPQYIAPERARDGDSTPESDLWSLGATLYAAVEGRSPFARSTTMATLTALATERPDPMRRAGPLRSVILGLLRKNVRSRLDLAEADRLLRRVADGDSRRGRRLPSGRRARAEQPDPAPVAPPTPPVAPPPTPNPVVNSAVPAVTDTPAPRPAGRIVPGARADPSPPKPVPAVVRDAVAPPTDTPANVADSAFTTRIISAAAVAKAVDPASGRAGDSETVPGPWAVAALRRSRRRVLVATTLAAVVVATLAIALPIAGLHLPGRPGDAGAVITDPTANTSPSPLAVATGPTVLDGVALPPGWIWYQDPSGFRVAVPQQWTYTRENSVAYFRDPNGDRLLAVGEWRPSAADPVAAWTAAEDTARSPDYMRLRLEAVTCPFAACAEWEYTTNGPDGPDGTPVRVISRGIRTASGRSYQITWRTKIFDWQINQSNYLVIIPSFHG